LTSAASASAITKKRKVELRFAEKSDFLDRYLADVGIGGYQWDGPEVRSGEEICFLITFIGLTRRFELTGNVVWRKSKAPMRPDLDEGVGIEFKTECENTLRDLVGYALLDEEDDALKSRDDRQQPRIRVAMHCEYLYNNKMVDGQVLDISGDGLYVETEYALNEEKRFIFFLNDEEYLRPLVLEGRVVWSNMEHGKQGFGLQFVFDSRKQKSDVQNYIKTLHESFDED